MDIPSSQYFYKNSDSSSSSSFQNSSVVVVNGSDSYLVLDRSQFLVLGSGGSGSGGVWGTVDVVQVELFFDVCSAGLYRAALWGNGLALWRGMGDSSVI